jgi:hypothetical protein
MSYPNITQDIQELETRASNLENTKVNSSDLINLIYPVGSIYMSVNYVSPSSFLGGTWEQIQDRFLLSSGSTYAAGSTGGEASHTLTVAETPAHSHRPENYNTRDYVFQVVRSLGSASTGRFKVASGTSYYTTCANPSAADYVDMDDITTSTYTTSVGSGKSHNNMPPYLTVYMWKRTA